MDIKDILFELSNSDAAGPLRTAADKAAEMLSKYCEVQKTETLTVLGFLKGESDYTLMVDAHIDQIAMIVTNIDDNGFLTVAPCGGFDLRALPSRRMTVHGKEDITAVFCSTPPHLSDGKKEYKDIKEMKLDTALGEKAKEIISFGDMVTFAADSDILANGRVAGRSYDDRSAVACLIKLSEMLCDKKLPVNVAFVLSDAEELGLRGVRPATFTVDPDESIAIDVSFGDGPDIKECDCGKLGLGGMIGISPSLDRRISNKLIAVAKDKEIPYQIEVMGERTGTNADAISVSRAGVPTCTLSIPLRNMHTETELLDLKDLDSVCNLLAEYILKGGISDDRTFKKTL